MPSYCESSIGTRMHESLQQICVFNDQIACVWLPHTEFLLCGGTLKILVSFHNWGATSCRWLAQAMYAGGLEGTRNKFVIALDAFACRFVNLFIHTNVRNLPNRSRTCEVHWSPTTTTAIAYPKMSSLLQVANIARIACYSLRSLGLATYFYDFDVSCACLRLSDQSAKNCVVLCCVVILWFSIRLSVDMPCFAHYSLLLSGSLSPNGRAAESSAPHHSHSDQWMLGGEMLRKLLCRIGQSRTGGQSNYCSAQKQLEQLEQTAP